MWPQDASVLRAVSPCGRRRIPSNRVGIPSTIAANTRHFHDRENHAFAPQRLHCERTVVECYIFDGYSAHAGHKTARLNFELTCFVVFVLRQARKSHRRARQTISQCVFMEMRCSQRTRRAASPTSGTGERKASRIYGQMCGMRVRRLSPSCRFVNGILADSSGPRTSAAVECMTQNL